MMIVSLVSSCCPTGAQQMMGAGILMSPFISVHIIHIIAEGRIILLNIEKNNAINSNLSFHCYNYLRLQKSSLDFNFIET